MKVETDIIKEAGSLIGGKRNEEYGSFSDNIDRMKMLMLSLTGKNYTEHELRSFFIALKLCRHDCKGFTKDTLVDLIGYAQLIHNDQEQRK